MRYRKKHGILEKLCEFKEIFVHDYKENKGKWSELFQNDNPIHIEIGCGRGNFINTLAINNPDINYIAIEKLDGIVLEVTEKIEKNDLKNIKSVCANINEIEEMFDEDELSKIYINFCDPWPKRRHSKRRLTHRGYLQKYNRLLCTDGIIEFKTDNRDLFEFSINEFCDFGFRLKDVCLNLHKDEETTNDIAMTEYESKFKNLGMNIYYLKALKYNWNNDK